jgi:LCP family protein required for cell wall assembly
MPGDERDSDAYRDPEPTRSMPRPGARGDGVVRDAVTGRPTPPRFADAARSPGDRRADAAEGAPAAVSRSVSSSPRSVTPPSRRSYPDPYEEDLAAAAPRIDRRDVDARRPGPPQRPPGPPRRPAPARRRRRMRLGRTILVLLLVVLVGYPLSLGLVAWRNVTRAGPLPDTADTPGTTYLLVGSDSREGLTAEDVNRLATGTAEEAGGRRTDTILLLHVPGGSQPPALISIPRDSFVDIPGRGQNKINAAYAFGGAPLLAQTVTGATGVGVDSYVETGLAGFAGIADAVGGVDICLPEPITDPNASIDLPAGCQTLTGPQALGLARSRKTDAQGDLARVERQRAILAAIVDQAASPASLLNPFTAYPLAAAGGSALTLDDGTGPVGVGRFALAMREVAGGGGLTLTVPVSTINLSTSAGSAVEWDPEASEQLWAALRANDMETVRGIAEAQESALNGVIGTPDQLEQLQQQVPGG